MKILVTGGSGFIGSALVRYLLQNHHQIINVDKLTYAANPDALKSAVQNPHYFFEYADIADEAKMTAIFATHQPDCVMHLAAESHVDRSIQCANNFIQSNIVGTYVLLETARQYWQKLPKERQDQFRFQHISTDEVYGDLSLQDLPSVETDTYCPSSPYSASKAASDHLVRAWHRTYGLPILLSYSTNNYGEYQHNEKFIPRMISQALQGKPLTIYGDGSQIRDWLFVQDHVEALYCILTHGRVGESYNISANQAYRNLDLVYLLCDNLNQLKREGKLTAFNENINAIQDFKQLICFVADRLGHDKRYAINSTKIQQQLGWQAHIPFEQGLRHTILWYVDYLAQRKGKSIT